MGGVGCGAHRRDEVVVGSVIINSRARGTDESCRGTNGGDEEGVRGWVLEGRTTLPMRVGQGRFAMIL